MSTTQTTGPLQRINGPLPVAQPFRLVDTATIVPEPLDDHWRSAWIYPYPPDLPYSWDPCATDRSPATKAVGGVIPLPIFGAFQVYLAETCQMKAIGNDQQAFVDRALASFAAVESYGVEAEFSRGLAIDTNPFLADSTLDAYEALNGGAATKPTVALALLEEAIGQSAKQGMIHATPGTVAMWDSTGYTLDTVGSKGAGQKLVTRAGGTPISRGAGYYGAQPSGGAAPTATKQWAFATGPVEIRRSEPIILPGDISEALNRVTNEVTYRVERDYLVDWDTTLLAAVLVDYTL